MLEPGEPGVRVLGAIPPKEFRALLRRARVFVCAPRREDYGIVQLEALADGCQLVSTEAPGPYAALPIARQLDARLVGEDLVAGLHAALEQPLGDYADRALAALAPFSRASVDRIVAEQLLPRLLA
jgi:glycosyltransferase involved in cell wall biosynthesis